MRTLRPQAASSRPYDTVILHPLFFSLIIPGAAALARGAGESMFD
jgi:hypothetical protein